MCGIAGIINQDTQHAVDRSRLEVMLGAIRHRGPDDQGLHVAGHVGLGMRRLSIIDLDGGQQPIFDEERRRALVFNGEIYNYRALRDGLLSRGHTFRTESDTETVVHLHEEMGSDCVQPLRGMFGFAVWDTVSQELTLAVDRFGIKPMYVAVTPDCLAFASELKALHKAGFTGADLDWEALESLFRVGYVPAPRTPFRNIQKLEPGHVLTWRPGQSPRTRRYWNLPTDRDSQNGDAATVRELLDESVHAHMVSDVPVAAFLSGGLDSSAVVSSMAAAGADVHAYTARYLGPGAAGTDETHLARKLAEHLGIRLTVVDIEPKVDTIFEPIVRALDEPHSDDSMVPTWLICERVASEYKVALTGTGGDELFAGYRRHFALGVANAWSRVPGSMRRAVSRMVERLPELENGDLTRTRVKRFLRLSGASTPARYLSLQNRLASLDLFTPDIRSELALGYTERTFERHGSEGPQDGAIRSALYMDYKTYLPGDLLHLADRISMAHSLELRVPFVDHRLVEHLFPLPDRVRVGMAKPKRMLKRALRPRLPAEHFSAPKRGFVGPTAVWLRTELAELLGDELSPDRLTRLGYFNVAEVERLRQEHLSGVRNHEGTLWCLLSFMTWQRLYMT